MVRGHSCLPNSEQTIMKNRKEICQGCKIYNGSISKKDTKFNCGNLISDYLKCPCAKCLIKTMCDKACETFDEFSNERYFNVGIQK